MNNALTTEERQQEMNSLKELVAIAIKSGNYPNMSEMTMLNIMLSAKDLGISPYKALNGGFYVVNGKIAMSTSLMTDRIRREGHSIKITEWTRDKCVLLGIRKDNQDSVKIEFTWEDAQSAGLTGSPVWKKYPKPMLYNRAMSMLARVLFPDVVGNCYSEDEGEEIGRNSFKPSSAKSSLPIEEDTSPPVSLGELEEKILDHVEVPEKEHLSEYLSFCESRVRKPMKEVVEGWIRSPKPFLDHYSTWCQRKVITIQE